MSNTRTQDPLPAALLKARLTVGITQVDAADIMGVTQGTVSRWEARTLGFHPQQRKHVEWWVNYWMGEK